MYIEIKIAKIFSVRALKTYSYFYSSLVLFDFLAMLNNFLLNRRFSENKSFLFVFSN